MQENTAKLTYRDVFLTDDVFARNEDGFEFRGLFYRRSSLVFGVGVNDFQFQTGSGIGVWKPYRMWQSMLKRAYDPSWHIDFPTYLGTEVDPSWHRFSGFLEWLWMQPYHAADFQLDKDLIGRGRFYGPEDCILVPPWANSFLIDSGAARGELPLGVSKHGNGFRVSVRINGNRLKKTFRTIEVAVEFYHAKKERICRFTQRRT